MAQTEIVWEQSYASQPTVGMAPIGPQASTSGRQHTAVSSAPPPPANTPSAQEPKKKSSSVLPIIISLAIIALLALLAGGGAYLFLESTSQVAENPTATMVVVENVPQGEPTATRPAPASLTEQQVGSAQTDTPTPEGPVLAIPVVFLKNVSVEPILLGALPSADNGLLRVDVRVQNLGNGPFTISTGDFSLRNRIDNTFLPEAGGTTSEDGLRRLGVIDRFDDLNLTPGGSVAQSLIFEVNAQEYDFEMIFAPPGIDSLVTGIGTVNAGADLALALGLDTPAPEVTNSTLGQIDAEDTPTPEPSPTPTRPPFIPVPETVADSSLVGTIAYPVFNGNSYDLYFGAVDGSAEPYLFRDSASQPAFSPDGSRIAFHSWRGDSRGLINADRNGGNEILIAGFIEDQLPTWTADGGSLVYLTRRSGDRKSNLVQVGSTEERADGQVIGEGEYPSIGVNGQMVFKGWGNTAYGLRIGTANLGDINAVTNADEDTAPALSPDGQQVVFMSLRENNWDVYLSNVDGSGLVRLTEDAAQDGLPTWSPDGEAIAFVSNRGGTWAIWVMTPEGDGKSQIITMQGSPNGFVGTDTNASRGWGEERISWTR